MGLAAMMVVLLGGCSTTKLAVGAMVPIMENSKNAALRSNDIKTFYAATPGNIFLLEGLIETDPKRKDLRITAAMIYFNYAFTVGDDDPAYASLLYLKGFRHGRTALLKNKDLAAVWDGSFVEFSAGMAALGPKDVPALAWTVGNWSQFVGLHLDSTAVLIDIPRVQALLERLVEIDGSFFNGLPHIMLGSLHAFRPPLMGGNPEASLEQFNRAMEVSGGDFLLARLFYAKFYCYRIQDGDEFEKTLVQLLDTPDREDYEFRLLNLIAKDKAAILLREKDDLF